MELNLELLKTIKLLGKGATGTVFLVHDPSTNSHFALKVTPQNDAVLLRRAHQELHVLTSIQSHPTKNPFLPSLISHFADHHNTSTLTCWATPYCPGGDLNALRQNQNDGVFSSSAIRFYLAEILCALEHLHSMGIAYRDLKPENILVQENGHVILTDFDLSKQLKKINSTTTATTTIHCAGSSFPSSFPSSSSSRRKRNSARVTPKKLSFERCNSFVGTDEYIAPEVVRGDGHEFAVDWWALGVLAYEMLYGTTPFKGKTKKETFRNIVNKEVVFCGNDRTGLIDMIGRLLEKEPTKRLGYVRGGSEIKEHVFFKDVRWDLLTEVLRPPVIPSGELMADAEDGVDIREYFRKLRVTEPSLTSPSVSIEFEEF